MTQQLYTYREELYGRPEVINHVRHLKEKTSTNFTLLDIGCRGNTFNQDFLTHIFDIDPTDVPGVVTFSGNINEYEDWVQILDYVEKNGKFDFCNCAHILQVTIYPMLALKLMPKIAKQGFISVPSKFYELQNRDLFKGGIHHRWIWNDVNGKLIAYPKLNLIETLTFFPHGEMIENKADTELRIFWKDTIDFEVINNDYLGPTKEAVVGMYQNLIP